MWTDSFSLLSQAVSVKQVIENFGNRRYFVARSAPALRNAGAVSKAALDDELWGWLDQTGV